MLYQTHARIHLDNIRHNILGIRQAIGAERKLLVSVKANAYGHGAVPVARLAEDSGVDWLSVATIPEGMELRQAGIHLPILKFSPLFAEEMEAAVQAELTLTVCERSNVELLEKTCLRIKRRANVHLKVDTGMGRIGVAAEEAAALAAYIENKCPSLHLQGVFTHLPVSDESDPTYTQQQIERFKSVVDAIQRAIERQVALVHCANSGAVLAHPDGWLDLVRAGIMVYGYYPDAGTPRSIPLKPGLSFLTRVSFLKKVAAGTSIGYGRTWLAPQDTWIATFSAGYADGFNRLLSNRGRVLINGRSYPIAGRVCMDQSMADLGPETDVRVGDEVVLIGKSGEQEITCDEMARLLGTITYEVICQINARVPRIYD